jgi:hypothetical protein
VKKLADRRQTFVEVVEIGLPSNPEVTQRGVAADHVLQEGKAVSLSYHLEDVTNANQRDALAMQGARSCRSTVAVSRRKNL